MDKQCSIADDKAQLARNADFIDRAFHSGNRDAVNAATTAIALTDGHDAAYNALLAELDRRTDRRFRR
jgi:hypothetical protein